MIILVPLSERSVSPHKYVSIPLEIEEATWEICNTIPKTHTFKISNHLLEESRKIVWFTQRASNIYYHSIADYDKKIGLLQDAYAECSYFFTQMDLAYNKLSLKDHLVVKWCGLVDTEMDKLSGEIKTVDREKQKFIKEQQK